MRARPPASGSPTTSAERTPAQPGYPAKSAITVMTVALGAAIMIVEAVMAAGYRDGGPGASGWARR
jgi:hypothetical protein